MKPRKPQIVFVLFLFAMLLYLPAALVAQVKQKYPQNYFRWPLNLSPEIVANMGELRSNHWHMGLDIRTNQKVDQLVYAAAEGYIAYVGIRPFSYGRFIIINHPNGLSTLYGHLNDFNPALEKYVTEEQYRLESWAVELTLPKDKFPVSKGSFIAYSGTTGGSQGPHVHFEIRDTKTDKCLNPLLFGMPLSDNVKPSMIKLAMYDRNYSVYEQAPKFFALKLAATGNYNIPGMPVIKTSSRKLSFSLQTFDRISGSNNQDGIYSAKLFFDNKPQLEFVIDSFDYNITAYMNAQIDYKYNANGGAYMQHLSALPGDRGGVYHIINSNGVLELSDTSVYPVRVEVRDAYGNASYLDFKIQYDEKAPAFAGKTSTTIFSPNNVNVLEKPDFEAFLPEKALYDSVVPFYFRSNAAVPSSVSALHQLNDESYPVHGIFTVRLKPDKIIPDAARNKIVIRRTYRGSTNTRVAQWQGDWLSADFADFGNFQAFADTQPPSINELGKADTVDMSPASRIVFTPADNSGIKSFRAELDGKWLRFTNDKGRNWIYIFDERCPDGVHELKVTVEDIVGNATTKTWIFKKYPYTPPKKKVPVRKKTVTKKKTVKKK